MSRILIVRGDVNHIDTAKDLATEVCRRLGTPPEIQYERNLTDARGQLTPESRFDLVIVDANIPDSRKDSVPVGDERRLGVRAIEELRIAKNQTPAIVISSVDDDRLRQAIDRIKPASMVPEGNDFGVDLAKQTERWLTDARTRDARLDVEIDLGDDRAKCWFKVKGRGIGIEAEGPLQVNEEVLERLIEDSRDLDNVHDEDWERRFHRLGTDLANSIFINNQKFMNAFDLAVGYMRGAAGDAHGDPNMRFRFVVESKVHPIALEALVDYDRKRFWMLHAPILRRLRGWAGGKRFDKGTVATPMNCLIIEANAYGSSKGVGWTLNPLKHVALEASRVEQFLEERKEQGHAIGKIRRFPRDAMEADATESFPAALERILDEESWHLVHFVGHSKYDKQDKRGYIAVPAPKDKSGKRDRFETVTSSQFAGWLGKSQFVSLSSCESSEEDFVYEMASAQVPAIAGFRWKIEDAVAPEYAMKFYKYLFDADHDYSLEDAFFRARRDLYNSHRKHKVWAAPVLVVQTSD